MRRRFSRIAKRTTSTSAVSMTSLTSSRFIPNSSLALEADVVLQPALPLFQQPWSDSVPELLLGGALDPFHLAIEVGTTWPNTGVADAQTLEQAREIATELGAVVRLDALHREGQMPQQTRQDVDHGGRSALLQDGGRQEAAAVVHQGELVAAPRKGHENHFGVFTR